jgi:hypothetical protein
MKSLAESSKGGYAAKRADMIMKTATLSIVEGRR